MGFSRFPKFIEYVTGLKPRSLSSQASALSTIHCISWDVARKINGSFREQDILFLQRISHIDEWKSEEAK